MKILILGRSDDFTKIIFNKIYEIEQDLFLIEEKKPKFIKFFRNRIKKYGFLKIIGQILLIILIFPILKKLSQKRITEIIKENNFSTSISNLIIGKNYFKYENINLQEVKEKIIELNPELIIVNGTRIISKNILESTDKFFINMHSGITPKYRGVHGAYWALVNNDKENCGVTIHVVDKGIDTGKIIEQTIISTTKQDNIITYPYLQLAKGVELEKKIINLLKEHKKINYKINKLPSKLYTHPSFVEYVLNYFLKKIK